MTLGSKLARVANEIPCILCIVGFVHASRAEGAINDHGA
jgi:hypothetical protein